MCEINYENWKAYIAEYETYHHLKCTDCYPVNYGLSEQASSDVQHHHLSHRE